MEQPKTNDLPRLLGSLADGDDAARDRLLEYANRRFETLARKMLRQDYPRLGRWADTGDILQGAMERFWRALASYVPADELAFRRLFATELRRELIDLCRKYFGPQGIAKNHESAIDLVRPEADQLQQAASHSSESSPLTLVDWAEFHLQADKLPEKLKAVFDVRYYNGLSIEEAAKHLKVSRATVILRWAKALKSLRESLQSGNEPPVRPANNH